MDAVTDAATAGRRVHVPLGCARLALPAPPSEAIVDVTYQDLFKLARALLDGCAQRKEEVAVDFAGQGSLTFKPDYMLRPHKAVQELGGLPQFYIAASSLASSFGAKTVRESELAWWGYAEWRIPPCIMPTAPAGEKYSYARRAPIRSAWSNNVSSSSRSSGSARLGIPFETGPSVSARVCGLAGEEETRAEGEFLAVGDQR